MKRNHTRLLAWTLTPAMALAASAAQAQTVDIGEIVITPNRTETAQSKVGSTVNVVSREQIEQQSLGSAQDYLSQIPGVSVSSQGGAGQESSLIVRGADKKYVKTLWNGIDISDPSATQVQPSLEHLLAGDIESIEVLKGSQSTLYGADAVAGVIGISTLGDFEDGVRYILSGEGGSFGTGRGSVGMQAADANGRLAVSISGLHTDGISAADDINGNTEKDAYNNKTVSIAMERILDEHFSLFGSALFIDSRTEFDDAGLQPTDNLDNFTDRRQIAARAGFKLTGLDGRLRNTFSAQINTIDRELFTTTFGPFTINFEGKREKFDWLGEYDVSEMLKIQAGADYEEQEFTSASIFGGNGNDTWIAGVWGQAIVSPIENLTLTGAVRQDEHRDFGNFTTWRATGAYLVEETGTKLRGSAATGFRAPSPFELGYVSFFLGVPNTDLAPEESTSWDAGIDQRFLGGALTAGITYFELDTANLIDYDFATDSYVQLPGTTKRSGVEASLRFAVTDWADFTAAYTHTRAHDDAGARRPRVPEQDVALGLFTRPLEQWTASATTRIVLDTVDNVGGAEVPLDNFVLVNAKIGYKPMEGMELYVRGENLLDKQYQVVKGYGTLGAAIYGGFQLKY